MILSALLFFSGFSAPYLRPANEEVFIVYDTSSAAAALYDGGWRSSDFEQLRTEYDLTEEEAQALCDELASIENK